MHDLETAAEPDVQPTAQRSVRRRHLYRASACILGLVAVGTIATALVGGGDADASVADRRRAATATARRPFDAEVEFALEKGRRLDMEAATTKGFKYANEYCVGKIQGGFRNADKDGNGYICRAAVGKFNCATPEQLGTLQCACNYCYTQCGMRNTPWEFCGAPQPAAEAATP